MLLSVSREAGLLQAVLGTVIARGIGVKSRHFASPLYLLWQRLILA